MSKTREHKEKPWKKARKKTKRSGEKEREMRHKKRTSIGAVISAGMKTYLNAERDNAKR